MVINQIIWKDQFGEKLEVNTAYRWKKQKMFFAVSRTFGKSAKAMSKVKMFMPRLVKPQVDVI